MKCLIFILCLLFILLRVSAQHQLIYKDLKFQYILTIDSVLSGDSVNYDCVVKTIQIVSLKNHKPIQVIVPEENYPWCGSPQDQLFIDQLFIIEDMNFDSMNDIRLLQFVPAAPNIPYYYWIYEPKTNRFIRNKALEKITSPDFDHKQKLISSFWRSSCCDHGLSIYKYVNGRLILIEESETAMDLEDNSKYIITHKKLIKGKWHKTRKIEKLKTPENK